MKDIEKLARIGEKMLRDQMEHYLFEAECAINLVDKYPKPVRQVFIGEQGPVTIKHLKSYGWQRAKAIRSGLDIPKQDKKRVKQVQSNYQRLMNESKEQGR